MTPSDLEHIKELSDRLTAMEEKVDRLLTLFERATGALLLVKIGGAALVGAAAVWTFVADHFKFH